MAENRSNTGIAVFAVLYLVFLAGLLFGQNLLVENAVEDGLSNYTIATDVLPVEWIIITQEFATEEEYNSYRKDLLTLFRSISYGEFGDSQSENISIGKKRLKQFTARKRQTLYFINPYIATLPMHAFFAGVLAFLISMFFPAGSGINFMRNNLRRTIRRHEAMLRKQFEAHDMSFESALSMDEEELEYYVHQSTLPSIILQELQDFRNATDWIAGKSSNPITPIKFYFRYHITSSYGNLIQGVVSGGAGVLIFVIGLRGLKLIPPEEPSIILMALSLEFVLLIVLMVTFAGSAQEERLDRVVKELEAEQRDAIKQQTTALHKVFDRGGEGGGNGASKDGESLADFEERRILDELMHQMLAKLEKSRK